MCCVYHQREAAAGGGLLFSIFYFSFFFLGVVVFSDTRVQRKLGCERVVMLKKGPVWFVSCIQYTQYSRHIPFFKLWQLGDILGSGGKLQNINRHYLWLMCKLTRSNQESNCGQILFWTIIKVKFYLHWNESEKRRCIWTWNDARNAKAYFFLCSADDKVLQRSLFPEFPSESCVHRVRISN